MNRLIAWMVENRVTSNLLMLFFIVGGLMIASQLKQEVFPAFELDVVQVSVNYPGASPEEVETGVLLSIEDEVRGLDGVKKVTSRAGEGRAIVTVELMEGADSGKALQDVTNSVDSIQSFPEEAERPIISLLESRRQVISLILYGDVSRRLLRSLGEKVRDELIALEGLTLVDLAPQPNIEISVEVPKEKLRSYGVTLDEIAQTIRSRALELPGGGIKSEGGEILLRTTERRDYAKQFAEIPILASNQGTQLHLGQIATVKEQFEEVDKESFFDGKPAVRVNVTRIGEQKPLDISAAVKEYATDLRAKLPDGIQATTWDDRAEVYRDRISLLTSNAFAGLILVLLLLSLFLEPRLACWVTLGIPISIVGGFILIWFTPVSINMVSLFAFILTLGIIVDDAIIVGENIYSMREKGLSFKESAIRGAQEISVPVVFAVLTNIVAFIPLFLVPGTIGKIFAQIPTIVCAVLLISLIESLLVLPSHLSHPRKKSKFWDLLARPSLVAEKWLHRWINNVYTPFAKLALEYRYLTIATAVALLILFWGAFQGGIIQFSFLPRVDNDIIIAQAELPVGVPMKTARELEERMVQAAKKVLKEEGDISNGIFTQIGAKIGERGPQTNPNGVGSGSHLVGAEILLVPSDRRTISGVEFSRRWEKEMGEVPGIDSLIFIAEISTGSGEAIRIELTHPESGEGEKAAQELAQTLASYQGVSQIDSGVATGKQQVNLTLKPEAEALGLSTREMANQVRASFFGAEALRQQRGRNEIKVMVRLPKKERATPATMENLILRTPSGGEIPLSEAATLDYGRSYTVIERTDGRRTTAVTADVDETVANANVILADVTANVLPDLVKKYPGLSYEFEGEQRDQRESLEALSLGFVFAMLIIYTLLAIPFASYIQPLIVMISIPFGIIGALGGHLLLGYEVSIMSMMGMVALAGVVVNDTLVLIARANENVAGGATAIDAVLAAGKERFRPILLTSLTTFFGLAPIIFETTVQARFLIPMAISLGFGVLFATTISLLLVPALYLIFHRKP